MRIFFASDHAGFALKNGLAVFARSLGHDVTDVGAHALDQEDDFPTIVAVAAQEVAKDPAVRAIVLGRSGQGEAMTANRFLHVRAAVYYGGPLDIVRLTREHNDANVLSLGAPFLSSEDAEAAVRIFLETPFSGEERHARRIAQIDSVASVL